MNKKILKTVKIILWGLVYTLPLIQFLIVVQSNAQTTLYDIITQYVPHNNWVATKIFEVFGASSDLNMWTYMTGIVIYLSYFVYISFAHICVDVILFLPDCCRYIFDKMTGGKDEDSL